MGLIHGLTMVAILFLTSTASAQRSITQAYTPDQTFYFNAVNISGVPQTVDVIARGAGGIQLNYYAGCSGHLGTICPSATECRNTNATKILPPGGGVMICFNLANALDASLPPTSAVTLQISVAEDAGAVVASGVAQGANTGPIFFNGGRAF